MGSNIITYLKDKFNILFPQCIAHLHLEETVSDIVLTAGNEQKLDLTLAAKHTEALGGWTFDNALTRFIWGFDHDFVPLFAGTASVEMTTGNNAVLTFKLKINGNLDILTTPATFSAIDRIQQLAAVDLTKNGEPSLKLNDFVEVWAVSDQNATYKIHSFQIALIGR